MAVEFPTPEAAEAYGLLEQFSQKHQLHELTMLFGDAVHSDSFRSLGPQLLDVFDSLFPSVTVKRCSPLRVAVIFVHVARVAFSDPAARVKELLAFRDTHLNTPSDDVARASVLGNDPNAVFPTAGATIDFESAFHAVSCEAAAILSATGDVNAAEKLLEDTRDWATLNLSKSIPSFVFAWYHVGAFEMFCARGDSVAMVQHGTFAAALLRPAVTHLVPAAAAAAAQSGEAKPSSTAAGGASTPAAPAAPPVRSNDWLLLRILDRASLCSLATRTLCAALTAPAVIDFAHFARSVIAAAVQPSPAPTTTLPPCPPPPSVRNGVRGERVESTSEGTAEGGAAAAEGSDGVEHTLPADAFTHPSALYYDNVEIKTEWEGGSAPQRALVAFVEGMERGVMGDIPRLPELASPQAVAAVERKQRLLVLLAAVQEHDGHAEKSAEAAGGEGAKEAWGAGQRRVPLSFLASKLGATPSDTELVVLDALASGVVSGSLDLLDRVVDVKGTAARVLSREAVGIYAERFGAWADRVRSTHEDVSVKVC